MTMAAIGTSVAVGAAGAAASYGLSQLNKPKAYNPSANNKLAAMQQQQLQQLAQNYQNQVRAYGDALAAREKELAGEYSTSGSGASTNYLTSTGNALSKYGSDISALAASAPQIEMDAAQAGLAFNANNLLGYGATADVLSGMSQGTRMNLINSAMPSWNTQYAQGMKNASDMQRGLVSTDVQGSLGRSSAFNALNSGINGGSGLGRNLAARDLGLNSLTLQQQGTSQAQALAGQQYGMAVNGLQTNAGTIMQNNGVNSGQAMTAAALGTGLAATGLQTGVSGQLSTQGVNYGGLMSMYGNVFNTGVSTNTAIMNAQAQAAAQAAAIQASGITGNYQTQMNGNLMNYQTQNAVNNWQNAQNQQLMSGLTSAAGSFIGGGGLNYLSGLGNGGLMSNGFYSSQGAAQNAYGSGANLAPYQMQGGGTGWYNQFYS